MKQLLTNSSLTTFRTCPRKYELRYEKGYVPVTESEPLYFGKSFHAALEAWYKSGRNLEAARAKIKEIFAGEDADKFMEAKITALMEGYHVRYSDEPYEVVKVEEEFRAPLLNPDSGQASKTFEMAGVLDRIMRDKARRFFICETKTTSEEIEDPAADYWRKLAMDSQISGYYLGLEAMGMKAETCIYDVIRKPTIRPYQAGKVRKADETPQEFYSRLTADIAERPNFYYARREVPRSASDLEEYFFDVWNTSQALRAFQLKGKFPRYTNSCTSFMGKCPYFNVCTGQTGIEDQSQFKKIEQKHQELGQVA